MSRPSDSERVSTQKKKHSKRKVKRIIESDDDDDEDQPVEMTNEWTLRGGTKISIDPEAAEKWKASDLRIKERKKKKDPVMPITINKNLSQEDLLEIGETLVEEINIDGIDLKTNIDTEAIHFENIDRAPGLTDAKLKEYNKQAIVGGTGGIDQACFVPLLWFNDVMSELPFMSEVHRMYLMDAKELATNTSASSFRDVWKHVIVIYSARKQDIADYLWHAQNSGSGAAAAASSSGKQQRVD